MKYINRRQDYLDGFFVFSEIEFICGINLIS